MKVLEAFKLTYLSYMILVCCGNETVDQHIAKRRLLRKNPKKAQVKIIQTLYFSSCKDKKNKLNSRANLIYFRFNFPLLPVLMKCFPIKFPSQFSGKFWLISMLYRISSQLFTIKLGFNYKHVLWSFWKIAPCNRV